MKDDFITKKISIERKQTAHHSINQKNIAQAVSESLLRDKTLNIKTRSDLVPSALPENKIIRNITI